MSIPVVDAAEPAVATASGLSRIEKLIAIAGAVLLVASQIVFASLATGWAVAGLFHLSTLTMTVIDGACLVGSLVFTVWFTRNALRAEGFVR